MTDTTTIAPSASRTPSEYQANIYDFVSYGHHGQHGVVDAVPGSGKTTTLIGAAKHVDGNNNLFVAFTKHIAMEIGNRLQSEQLPMRAGTIHSTGYAALRAQPGRWQVDGNKFHTIMRNRMPNADRSLVAPLVRALELSRITRTPVASASILESICNQYNIDLAGKGEDAQPDYAAATRIINLALTDGDQLARRRNVIDYADMICLPVEWNLAVPQHDTVFIDEAQDLNQAQLEFVLRCVRPDGRMLFVGDKRQAIYGFAGADTTSIATITQRVNATVLPLSICYRCPKSHIALAANLYPGIEPAPWAQEGIIDHINEDTLYRIAEVGDMILCRTTKPLVAACLGFIRAGVPARVRGRDIGAQLAQVVRQVGKRMPSNDWSSFAGALHQYQASVIEAKQKKGASELEIQSVQDRVMSIETIYESTYDRCSSIDDLEREIAALFSDEQTGITLSTVHKAKGLEADRVFILHPELMPHPKAQSGWETEQERNIQYVAYTRSKQYLAFVQPAAGN